MSNSSPRSTLRLLADWRLLVYNLAVVVFAPVLLFRKIRRHFTKKTAYEFLRHRWTIPLQGGENDDPQALHIVFVSTGFGEKHTTEQLDAALKAVRPQVRTTWATKADVTVENIRQTSPQQAVTYMPFDFWPSVAWWLKRLNPDVVISVEKLWVPNILWGAKLWGAPVAVVSGRAGRYAGEGGKGALWRHINRWTLSACDILCLQSETEKTRLEPVLPPDADVRITGIIKITQRPATASQPSFDELTRWMEIQNARKLPILAAGSTTFRGEEEFVLDAFEKARAQTLCLLLLAPRRLHRVDEVLDQLRARKLSFAQRSKFAGASTPETPDVLVLDSMGELSFSYSFAEAAFVGGTLQGPGHNVIEPLEWGVPVYFGPGDGSVPATQQLALDAGAGFRVHSADELAQQWSRVLQDRAERENLRQRCESVIEDQRRALEENLKAVIEVVDRAARLRAKSEK